MSDDANRLTEDEIAERIRQGELSTLTGSGAWAEPEDLVMAIVARADDSISAFHVRFDLSKGALEDRTAPPVLAVVIRTGDEESPDMQTQAFPRTRVEVGMACKDFDELRRVARIVREDLLRQSRITSASGFGDDYFEEYDGFARGFAVHVLTQ